MIAETDSTDVVFPTELGWMGLAISQDSNGGPQIDQLTFGQASASSARETLAIRRRVRTMESLDWTAIPEVREWVKRLESFAAGRCFLDLSDLRLNLSYLTDFGRKVVEACRSVPWGETVSYGELAKRIGSPNASRAVGGVMARNRHPLIVPCHRIIASTGALVGFSAPDGIKMKQRLLENEQTNGGG